MPPMYYKLRNKRFVLDECIEVKNKLVRKKFGFVNAKDITKEGTHDDELLEKAKKKNLTLITTDIRFALRTIVKGTEIIFQDHYGTRTFIPARKTTVVEYNCNNQKYSSLLTYYLQDSEEIIIP